MASDTSIVAATETDWRAVADELATALRETLVRNPTLPARAWDQGRAALGRYDNASGNPLGEFVESQVVLRRPSVN